MNLDRHGRETYALKMTTEPAIDPDGWEASFDYGATWATAIVDGEWSTWLVAGSNAEPGDAVAVIHRSVTPKIRVVDNPEIVVRAAPSINLV